MTLGHNFVSVQKHGDYEWHALEARVRAAVEAEGLEDGAKEEPAPQVRGVAGKTVLVSF